MSSVGECIYCGKFGGLTSDHVPLRCLFSKPRGDDRKLNLFSQVLNYESQMVSSFRTLQARVAKPTCPVIRLTGS